MKKLIKESGLRNINDLSKRYEKAKIYFHQDLDGVTTALAMKNYLENNGIKVVDSEIIQYGDKEFAVKKQDAKGDTMPVLVDFAHGKPMFVVHTDHHDSQTGVEGDTSTSFRSSRSNVETLSQIMSPSDIFTADDIRLISTVDSADFAKYGLEPQDIMNFVFKLQKDKSLQKNKMALGLATNKLMLAYKNKPGFMEDLVMTSQPSLLNIFQNINRLAAEKGYALPEEMALNQKDYVQKQKDSDKVYVDDGIIVQYGGGSMFKPGSYDRYTPFKNNPEADFIVIAWPMGLVQASCNPFKGERELKGVNLGDIAQEVLSKWESQLREKIIPLSTIKWISEGNKQFGDESVGFTNADLEAFYGDKVRSMDGGDDYMEKLKDIMDKPSTKLTEDEWEILDKLGVPAWEMIQANSGGHKCITNISALNYFGRGKRKPEGKYKYSKDKGDSPYVKFVKMIQKEFVRKLKEKINESKGLNESVLNEATSFLFPIGNEEFNVGYDSAGLGRGKKKVLDKDKAIHNSDYGSGDAKHQHRGGHLGIDIFAPKGTPLISATDGEVIKVRKKDRGVGGKTVSILTNGIVYYYAHLDSVSNEIKKGDDINKGTFIGTVGDSGNAKGTHPHLHFSMYEKRNGYKRGTIDPWPFLKDSLDGGELMVIEPDQVVDKVEGTITRGDLSINDIVKNGDNSELISLGSQGEGVEEIQKILDKEGYDLGEDGIDGIYGSNTMRAVKKFQRKNGLNLIDGIVGIETSTEFSKH
jgi:murein DD-endopeptidase MepM/ murein hydrolase activator NlpD